MRHNKVARTLYGIYAMLILLSVASLVTIILVFTPGLRLRRRMARFAARTVFALAAIPIRTSGSPPIDRPAVVVANHASYIDGMLMFAILPVNFDFVIKREMLDVPGASLLLRRLGMEFVERFAPGRSAVDARRLMRNAQAGRSFAAFPEGTFQRTEGLGKFHSGAFRMAVAAASDVVPATINGSRQLLPADQWLPRPGRLEVIFHEAISVRADGGREEMVRVQTLAREAILTALSEPDLGHFIDPNPADSTNAPRCN